MHRQIFAYYYRRTMQKTFSSYSIRNEAMNLKSFLLKKEIN